MSPDLLSKQQVKVVIKCILLIIFIEGRVEEMLSRFLEDENGQGVVEYIVILSACVTGSVALARQILSALDTGIVRIGAQLEKDLKTGRAPLSVWQN